MQLLQEYASRFDLPNNTKDADTYEVYSVDVEVSPRNGERGKKKKRKNSGRDRSSGRSNSSEIAETYIVYRNCWNVPRNKRNGRPINPESRKMNFLNEDYRDGETESAKTYTNLEVPVLESFAWDRSGSANFHYYTYNNWRILRWNGFVERRHQIWL